MRVIRKVFTLRKKPRSQRTAERNLTRKNAAKAAIKTKTGIKLKQLFWQDIAMGAWMVFKAVGNTTLMK
ncbi:hypothetical protein DXV75_07940 [Alteromonas aestuariivivens]|uniref:Uncharacterized protein n=1 Tax=Alteromonas aestuariivivens TaxID=1938339 RepID=A0A3D8M8K1_9ALTE|nr:hypothetical protein DXV75_07940 [Alteromonas aestuariivivens]